MVRIRNGISVLALQAAFAASALAANIGYYEISAGQGQAYQVAAITQTGNTPVLMTSLSPAALAGINALYVLGSSNGAYPASWTAALPDIQVAALAGLKVAIFDRATDPANNTAGNMPGLSGVTFVRDTTPSVDPVANGNPIVNGPFGVIGATTLDGGNSSAHGYGTSATLPAGAVPILNDGNATNVQMFSYPIGAGTVYYSSVPMDFYINGGNDPPRTAMLNILLRNTLAAIAGGGPVVAVLVPTLSQWGLLLLALLLGATAFVMRKRLRG